MLFHSWLCAPPQRRSYWWIFSVIYFRKTTGILKKKLNIFPKFLVPMPAVLLINALGRLVILPVNTWSKWRQEAHDAKKRLSSGAHAHCSPQDRKHSRALPACWEDEHIAFLQISEQHSPHHFYFQTPGFLITVHSVEDPEIQALPDRCRATQWWQL